MVSKAQVMALASSDAWLAKGANILLFVPPGAGKSHLSAALGLALVEIGWRVMFARTTDLVQRLRRIQCQEGSLTGYISTLDPDPVSLRTGRDADSISVRKGRDSFSGR
jgi:DNA replication protein DnaC